MFRVAVQHDRQYYDIISDRHWIGYRLDSGALARVILRILRALQFIGHDRYRRAKTTLVLSSTHTNWMRFWCCFALMVYGPFYICQKTTDGIILNRWVHLSVPNWVKMNESRRRAHTNRPSSAHTHPRTPRAIHPYCPHMAGAATAAMKYCSPSLRLLPSSSHQYPMQWRWSTHYTMRNAYKFIFQASASHSSIAWKISLKHQTCKKKFPTRRHFPFALSTVSIAVVRSYSLWA